MRTHRVRARILPPLAAAVSLLATLPQPSAAPGSHPRPPSRVAFWAGEEPASPDTYWEPRDLTAYTDEVWQALEEAKVVLYINLRYGRDFGPIPPGKRPEPDGLELVREANRRDIPVWAWLVVPYEDGYWAWEGNAARNREAFAAYLEWAEENDLDIKGVAIDSEPSYQEMQELYAAFGSDPTKLPAYVDKTISPRRQCEAVRGYAALIEDAHDANVQVVLAAYPLALDDLRDGMLALQDTLDVATAPPLGWDAWFFMAYRSIYASLFPVDAGTGLVTSYFRSAQEAFGPRGQITLGIPGVAPYDTIDPMITDIRALATMGAERIPIYSLELTVKHFGVEGLQRVLAAADEPFEGLEALTATAPTVEGEGLRTAIAALDAVTVAATPIVTRDHDGGPQLPNRYPDCAPPLDPLSGGSLDLSAAGHTSARTSR